MTDKDIKVITMAHWKATKRQRGNVKAHEAKNDGKVARRSDDKNKTNEGIYDWEEEDAD